MRFGKKLDNQNQYKTSQELEQVEDHYKQETKDLLNTVKRLQDENRKLSNSLVAANERDSAFSEDGKCNDIVICISTTVYTKIR